MGANPRTKGADGERQVIKMLVPIVKEVMTELDYPADEIIAADQCIQRNQNQSAVGGNDLTGTFGISIEVKRQEQLSINTWWKQCCEAASRNNELPLLIWKQNRKPWRIRTLGFLHVMGAKGEWTSHQEIVELDEAAFRKWFRAWVKGKLQNGYEVKV